jgi:hypothetical protein
MRGINRIFPVALKGLPELMRRWAQLLPLPTPGLGRPARFSRLRNYFLTEIQKATVTKRIVMECPRPGPVLYWTKWTEECSPGASESLSCKGAEKRTRVAGNEIMHPTSGSLKSEGRGFETRRGGILNLPNPSGRTSPGVYSASNRNEYRKHKKKCFWGVERCRCIGLTTLPPSISRLSGQCGILNISRPYRPPRPVTGTAFLYLEPYESPENKQGYWNEQTQAALQLLFWQENTFWHTLS